MSSVLNQFSAVLTYIILALVILSLLLWRIPLAKRRPALLVGLGVVVVAGLLIFRPVHQGVAAVTVSDVMARGSDKPVFVELYSDYWLACLRAKPVVDGLEAEWGGAIQVMRLNVQEPTAQPLLAELGFRFTPTFILFAKDGREVWRTVGSLAAAEVNEQIDALE